MTNSQQPKIYEPTLLFVKPGALSQDAKDAIKEIGVTAIEIDSPLEVKFVRAGQELSGSAMLTCAMKAILSQKTGYSSNVTEEFGHAIAEAILSEVTGQ